MVGTFTSVMRILTKASLQSSKSSFARLLFASSHLLFSSRLMYCYVVVTFNNRCEFILVLWSVWCGNGIGIALVSGHATVASRQTLPSEGENEFSLQAQEEWREE